MHLPLFLLPLVSCTSEAATQQDTCADVPGTFARHAAHVLSDTTGRFFNDYPTPTPLTCEVLGMLQEELKGDSARYYFEHIHQRFGDPRASAAFSYSERRKDFHVPMALLAHWNPDTRLNALRALQDYRRFRPLVCTTKEGNAQLERQDRAAVRYLIRVLETTPFGIAGSENSTIHDIYMRMVMETLDLFTGQDHMTSHADDPAKAERALRINRSGASIPGYIADWRKWLEQ